MAIYANDKKLMKKYINILSNFKSYQDCINEFIYIITSKLIHIEEKKKGTTLLTH